MFTVSFFGDEEQFPRYLVGENYPTQHAALLACEADLRRQAMAGRKHYNDLCYYDITEYNEEDERGDTVNAAELPPLALPNLGDWVHVQTGRKSLYGEIVQLEAGEDYHFFVVAALLKNGKPSSDRTRRYFFHVKDLHKVTVYERFTPTTPTPDGPTWVRVPIK